MQKKVAKELAEAKLKLALKPAQDEVKRLKLVVTKAKRAAFKAGRVAASKLQRAVDELKLAEDKLELNAKPAPAPDAVPDEKHELAEADLKLKLAQDEVKALKLVVAEAEGSAAQAGRVAASKLKLLEDELKLAEDKLELCAEPAPAPDAVLDDKHEQACESAITWWRLPRVIVRRGRCPMLTASGRRAPEFCAGRCPTLMHIVASVLSPAKAKARCR